MRKTLLILAIAGGSMVAPTFLQTPVQAGVFWSVGSVFSVGGLDFALVFGRPGGLYGDGQYYRTREPLHYRGYSCHNGCSFRAGYHYHHRDCSVLRHHFRRNRFLPDRFLSSSPWAYGGIGRWDGHRRDYRHDDRYRYDRYRHDRRSYDDFRGERYRYESDRYDRNRYDRDRYRHDDSDSDSDRYDRSRQSRGGDQPGRYDRDRGGRDDQRRRSAHDSRSPRGRGSRP
jgi:hypothetical protein